MSTDATRSSEHPSYGDTPETPTGIWVVAVLGLVGAVLSVLGGVGLIAAGAVNAVLGVGLLVLAVAQEVTMLALVGITPWAWYATVGLYSLSAALNLITDDGGGLVVSLLVVGYVVSKRELYLG